MGNDPIKVIDDKLYPAAYEYQIKWVDEIINRFGEIGKIWKDRGYFVSNYGGHYCSGGQDNYCILGDEDMKKQPEEILEVPMRNFKTLDKFRKFIEGKILHKPYSWVLDDLNPKTTYDKKITEKIDETINLIKWLPVKEVKQEEGKLGKTYKERSEARLAIGLLWFVATPEVYQNAKGQKSGESSKSGSVEEKSEQMMLMKDQLGEIGFGKFAIQLSQEGGLRVESADENEYSALEVLKAKKGKRRGKCKEMSRVLFGILRRAGLKPDYYMVKLKVSDVEKMDLSPKLREYYLQIVEKLVEENPDFNHICVGVRIGEKLRLLDPMFFQEDANYQEYVHLPPRQFFSAEAVDRGEKYFSSGDPRRSRGEYMFAIAMDPLNPRAYASLGAMDYNEAHLPGNDKGKLLDNAISSYSEALKIYPSYIQASFGRGAAYLAKGEIEMALDDFSGFLKLKGDTSKKTYDVLYDVLQKYYLDKWWQSKKVNINDDNMRLLMAQLLAQCEAHIKGAGVLWRANDTEQVYKELEAALDVVQKYDMSVNLEYRDDILKDMFSTLPAEMMEDKTVGELKKKIKQKFPGQ